MAFIHTLVYSSISALVMGALFYLLSINRGENTTTDTNLGSVFIFLLALIIGLSLWPRILERKKR